MDMVKKWSVLVSLIAMNIVEQMSPEVKISQGTVRGRVSDNGEYFEFLGIPYGSITAKERFQAPGPPPNWNGMFHAVVENARCLQILASNIVIGQEDCLKINVYTPSYALQIDKLLPVMVFVHGGGFVENSATNMIYGAEFIVKHDVILVTFNYRLGVLGFLSLNIKEAPGNAGLKDQVAALRWVKTNIAAFGGDPDNVTLFGESAGGVSVSLLLLSPLTKNLFKRVIIHSGSSLAPWALMREPIKMASLLAKELGYQTMNPHELYKIFVNMSAEKLVSTKVLKPKDGLFSTRLVFVPSIEKQFEGLERVVTDLPVNIIESGNYTKLPVILGFNDKEGYFMMHKEGKITANEKNNAYLFMNDVEFYSEKEKNETSAIIKEFYFRNKYIDANTFDNLTELYSDLFFKMPALFETELLLKTSNKPIYNYCFKFDGNRNLMKLLTGYWRSPGATHADELFYLFKTKILFLPLTYQDSKIINWMTTTWTNFAKHGYPTLNSPDSIQWPRSEKGNMKFFTIDKKLSVLSNPVQARYELWRKVYSGRRKKTL